LLVTVCISAAASAAFGQTSKPKKSILEKVEWTWAERPEAPDPALANVLLVGDSITRAYFPEVAKLLAGKVNVYLFATSAATGDPRLARQLHDYFAMEHLRFAVVHFNNGMHGWGYSEREYSAGLPAMVRALRQGAPAARLIWAATTPVHKAGKSGADNQRIDARNAAALVLMKRLAIPVDDQHLLMSADDDLHSDDVHYKPEGSRIQAQQVVKTVEQLGPFK
jgi:hypothetical protein